MVRWVVQVDDGTSGPPDGLAALEAACREHDAHAPFDEHTLLTLQGQRQVPHARLVVRGDDHLVGCGVLSEGLDAWYVELAVTPTARGAGAGRALLEAAHTHVCSHGGGLLRGWAHAQRGPADALAAAVGAEVERTLLVLHRPLGDVPHVPGVRPLREGERDAWLALSNAAFVGHPENGGWARADLDWRMDAAWSDARRCPVVPADDGLLAGVWTKIDPACPDEGELYVVAVQPSAQGRGLGRRVVDAALHSLQEAGCRTAVLYVDAGNTAAVRLYAAAGFSPREEHRCLATRVPARLPVP